MWRCARATFLYRLKWDERNGKNRHNSYGDRLAVSEFRKPSNGPNLKAASLSLKLFMLLTFGSAKGGSAKGATQKPSGREWKSVLRKGRSGPGVPQHLMGEQGEGIRIQKTMGSVCNKHGDISPRVAKLRCAGRKNRPCRSTIRTCSRDPIGFFGSEWSLYEFVKGKPLVGKDPTGNQLLPDGPACKYRESNCELACSDPNVPKTGGGGVVCINGIPCACVFGFPEVNNSPGDCPALDSIIKDHEVQHIDEVDCGKPGIYRALPKRNIDRTTVECRHRRQSIRDLLQAIPEETNARCNQIMTAALEAAANWVAENCQGVPR